MLREDGYEAVPPREALALIPPVDARLVRGLRHFVADARLTRFSFSDLDDHAVVRIVREAVANGDLLILRAGKEKTALDQDSTKQQRRLVREIDEQTGGRLVHAGRLYRLVAPADLPKLADRESYEVVRHDDARRVLEGLSQQSTAPLTELLRQANDQLTRDWRPPASEPDGVILLRRRPVIAAAKREEVPPVTPSQLRALMEKSALAIHVVDLDGVPQKGLAYAITTPDGGSASGTLDDDGRAEAKSSTPGIFTVKFPELDGADWDGDGALELPADEERSEAGKHQVEQGERLPTIARAEGFARWQTVWDFPGNAALRELRGNGHILYPGDGVAIPSKLERTAEVEGGTAEYVVQTEAEILRVRFAEVESIADSVTFRAVPDAGDEMFEGELAEDGTMEIALPPETTKVEVALYAGDSDDAFVSYELEVGSVDPCSENTGIQGRLSNLGYYDGDVDGNIDDATRGAIVRFRREYGLPLSDEIDDDLRDALEWIHDGDADTAECEADQTTAEDFETDEGGEANGGDEASIDEDDGEIAQGGEEDENEDEDQEDEDEDLELVEWAEDDWGDAADENGPDDSALDSSDAEETTA